VRIEKLLLTQFKNYRQADFQFCPGLNCLLGENGSGKTNLMDAIYFLSLTKSAFHSQDQFSISHGEEFFMLDGGFVDEDRKIRIKCSVHRQQRKALFADGKPYERFSEHIGRFPVVLVEPGDTDLIREGSEVRRKFFDGVISQMIPSYLQDLLAYSKYLGQRNALLKLFAERSQIDSLLLDAYDDPLVDLSERLSKQRADFCAAFEVTFKKHYQYLSQGKEHVSIFYETEIVSGHFKDLFKKQRSVDVLAQRTTKGLHKDEYVFQFDGVPLKKFASQGQLKSFALALRLAQFELMEQTILKKPILLLDDVFDKLDDLRIDRLLSMIENGVFGQIFISDARPDRARTLFEPLSYEKKFFDIKKELYV
jgi:DNA replication and repair protein RecF